MSEWREDKISDIIELIHGHQFRDTDFVDDGIPVIKIGQLTQMGKIDLSNCSYIDKQRIEIFKNYKIVRGDVLMALTGATLGKTVKVDNEFGDILQNYRVGKFIPKNNFINQDFIYYILTSNYVQNEIILKINTAAQGNIGKGDFQRIKIRYPEISIQKKIAQILTTCDTVIEQTQAAIEKYKAIKQGMLHDLFTRGLTASGQLRPTPQQAPELYKQSELGLIPKEWEVKRLEELTTKIGDGIHTTPIYVESSDYHFINGNNLSNGLITISGKTNCVSTEEYEKHKIQLNDKTLLMSINGTIGNLAYYRNEKVILGKSAAYICCNDIINEDYLFYLLSTKKMMKYFEDELTGSTIKNLSLASIRKSPILYPKIEEQIKLVNALSNFDTKLQSEEALLSKYQSIKKGLMSDLLSGKREVWSNRMKYHEL